MLRGSHEVTQIAQCACTQRERGEGGVRERLNAKALRGRDTSLCAFVADQRHIQLSLSTTLKTALRDRFRSLLALLVLRGLARG